MIRITGDCHGDILKFIENNINDELWNADDFLIICGDFGFVFSDSIIEKAHLDYLEKKPYTIVFCDGNHENFSLINSYPEEEWHGGRVHRIRDNIYHLMRGQVYELDGKKIFTMGGAYSIDRKHRKLGFSYWEEELPQKEEYEEAINNLAKHDNKVDIIITHTAPNTAIDLLKSSLSEQAQKNFTIDTGDEQLRAFLERIYSEVDFEKWFFGHFHCDRQLNEKLRAVYYDVVDI